MTRLRYFLNKYGTLAAWLFLATAVFGPSFAGRNGSGVYTVPNTFVAGTAITAASHNANWADVANELTNSIAADGQTTITGALKGANGSAAAPAYSFASDLDSGLYRIGTNNVGIAAGGVKIIDISSTGITVTGGVSQTDPFRFADGTVGAPSVAFTSDSDTGFYRIGANNIGVAANGAKVLDIGTGGLSVTGTLGTTGALSPASMAGTISGTPTFSGAVAFTGTPTFTGAGLGTGTYSGNATFSGATVFNNAAGISSKNTSKAYGKITWSGGTPTLVKGFNITSINDDDNGTVTVTIATDFSDANYVCTATTTADGLFRSAQIKAQTAGTVTFIVYNQSVSKADPDALSFDCVGD